MGRTEPSANATLTRLPACRLLKTPTVGVAGGTAVEGMSCVVGGPNIVYMKPADQLAVDTPSGMPPPPSQTVVPPVYSPNIIVLLVPSGTRATEFREL